MSKSNRKDETSLHRIQQALFSGSRHSFHAAVIPLVLSFGASSRSGTRPSTTDPPSTTAATADHCFAPPSSPVFAVYLAFYTLWWIYRIALLKSCPPGLKAQQSCGNFAKPHCRDIVPLFFPLCSAQAGFCSSPLQVRTKEHLALNQAGFITCYGNFHNTNIKIIGQDSISPSATVAKVIKDGFRRCCSTSYCALQGLMSLWWRNAGKVSENHQK